MKPQKPSWKERAKIARSIPNASLLTFLGGAACLFAGVGSLNDCLHLERSTAFGFFLAVTFSAVSGAGWAFLGSRRMLKSIIAFAILHIIFFALLTHLPPPPERELTSEQWRSGIAQHVVFTIVLIYLSYALFVAFFRMEGRRLFAVQNEIELASQIQRKLVPQISLVTDKFEFFGISKSSGAVGGDLFDVVQHGDVVCAYLADIAGHGVQAGVLMSMVKTAVRSRLAMAGSSDGLLQSANEVLTPMTDSHSYATFAYALCAGAGRMKFALAGHLPLLHLKQSAGVVEQHSIENLPLAMFQNATFETAEFDIEPGDLVAMITDGLTEVFNKNDVELGDDYIRKILLEWPDRPLDTIANRIFETAEKFGAITDDRTLLLLRCKPV